MAQTGCSSSQGPGPSQVGPSHHQDPSGSTTTAGHYAFAKAVLLSPTGGCRVLSYCQPLGCLLASQPSPQAALVPGECPPPPFLPVGARRPRPGPCSLLLNNPLFPFLMSFHIKWADFGCCGLFLMPGCGVKKVSAVNLKACQYVPIHAKQIRGLAFSRQADGLLLSAALDNTLKLTRYWALLQLLCIQALLQMQLDASLGCRTIVGLLQINQDLHLLGLTAGLMDSVSLYLPAC